MKALLKTACGCKRHIQVSTPPPPIFKMPVGYPGQWREFELVKFTDTGVLYIERLPYTPPVYYKSKYGTYDDLANPFYPQGVLTNSANASIPFNFESNLNWGK
jgi:hypothetical protein